MHSLIMSIMLVFSASLVVAYEQENTGITDVATSEQLYKEKELAQQTNATTTPLKESQTSAETTSSYITPSITHKIMQVVCLGASYLTAHCLFSKSQNNVKAFATVLLAAMSLICGETALQKVSQQLTPKINESIAWSIENPRTTGCILFIGTIMVCLLSDMYNRATILTEINKQLAQQIKFEKYLLNQEKNDAISTRQNYLKAIEIENQAAKKLVEHAVLVAKKINL